MDRAGLVVHYTAHDEGLEKEKDPDQHHENLESGSNEERIHDAENQCKDEHRAKADHGQEEACRRGLANGKEGTEEKPSANVSWVAMTERP